MLGKLLLALALVGVASGSFFAVRELAIGGATVRERVAQVQPLEQPALAQVPTPAPTPAAGPDVSPFVQEQNRLSALDRAKARFEGVLNGIRFITPETFKREGDGGCLGIPGLRAEYADPVQVKGTELDIVLTYPPDARLDRAWASSCAGELVVLEHEYLSTLGVTIARSRATLDRLVVISAPRVRLIEGTIRGHPAVFVAPVNQVSPVRVYVAEPFGLTSLVGESPMTLEELKKIAEGLK